jgi:Kef-type K+ transport system membrane component KefB
LLKERIEHGISTLAYSLFVPIFFVNIGLSVNIRSLGAESLWLFLSMVLVAVVGKVLGAGWGANLGGLSRREAFQLGVGMISRGEVGLIVASVGIAQGVINESVFSGVVGMVVVTTLITPLLLRRLFVKAEAKQAIVEIAQGEER